ncbi:MAG: hypothetical protein ACKPJJ_20165, partial [Planctomycetaceae bacterium]
WYHAHAVQLATAAVATMVSPSAGGKSFCRQRSWQPQIRQRQRLPEWKSVCPSSRLQPQPSQRTAAAGGFGAVILRLLQAGH